MPGGEMAGASGMPMMGMMRMMMGQDGMGGMPMMAAMAGVRGARFPNRESVPRTYHAMLRVADTLSATRSPTNWLSL